MKRMLGEPAEGLRSIERHKATSKNWALLSVPTSTGRGARPTRCGHFGLGSGWHLGGKMVAKMVADEWIAGYPGISGRFEFSRFLCGDRNSHPGRCGYFLYRSVTLPWVTARTV